MNDVIRALMSTTHDRHEDLRNLVSGLPLKGLTWSPGADVPTIAGLVLHMLDVERYLTAVAIGDDIGWTGTRGSRIEEEASAAELLAVIDETDERLKAGLESLTGDRLASRAPGQTQTVGQVLIEDFDHVATHQGQVQLMLNLCEIAHPTAPRTYEHWR